MPKGIRPTRDKVRKALFDILSDMEGVSFLELFAGSGAIGFEALSLGAAKVTFVEDKPECLRTLKVNLAPLTVNEYSILSFDASLAVKWLAKKGEHFDVIFLDPPYYQDLAKKALQSLASYDILAPNGFLIVEHFKRDALPDPIGNLSRFREARYGNTLLSFYKKL